MKMKKIWSCKIGEVDDKVLPRGCDLPMRNAVEAAYYMITGERAQFNFSGWGAALTESERAVVENREPRKELIETQLQTITVVLPPGWRYTPPHGKPITNIPIATEDAHIKDLPANGTLDYIGGERKETCAPSAYRMLLEENATLKRQRNALKNLALEMFRIALGQMTREEIERIQEMLK